MASTSPTLVLMCRSLNALWAHVRRTRPRASRAELELAMAHVLRKLETAEYALGKEWMQWVQPRLPRQPSKPSFGKPWPSRAKRAPAPR